MGLSRRDRACSERLGSGFVPAHVKLQKKGEVWARRTHLLFCGIKMLFKFFENLTDCGGGRGPSLRYKF